MEHVNRKCVTSSIPLRRLDLAAACSGAYGLTRVSRTNGAGNEGYRNILDRHAPPLLPALLPALDLRSEPSDSEPANRSVTANSGLPRTQQTLAQTAKNPSAWTEGFFVEPRGIEPLTSSMPWKRSTN